jgi:hypothetical protein
MAFRALYLSDEIDPHQRVLAGCRMMRTWKSLYRCPDQFLQFDLSGELSDDSGYFRFGHDTICYGRSAAGYRARRADAAADVFVPEVRTNGSPLVLPFDPTGVIDNLRFEHYAKDCGWNESRSGPRLLRDLYYFVRPWMGLGARKSIQRAYVSGWEKIGFPAWPVDTTVEQINERVLCGSMKAMNVDRVPFIWFWPNGARGAVAMTHDVEAQAGYDFCANLMAIDDSFGIKSSFQIVPEGRYQPTDSFLEGIRKRGFEVNIQDLNHDGRLFSSRKEFLRRAKKINQYGHRYGAKGFRAAVLYRNLAWYDALEFSYDMSVPNVAHLDPQRGGCCTVMPYFVGDILEIPVTTTQDYMLFHLLGDYSTNLWKAQTEAILKKNGLMSFLVHPDYLLESRARDVYRDLLGYLSDFRSREQLWFALPGEIDHWWRDREQMRIVRDGGRWQIKGPGAERAVLAFAKVAGDQLEYEMSDDRSAAQCSKSS